jgi:hypothetical protein
VKSPDSRPLIRSSVVASIKLGNGTPLMAVLVEHGKATWAFVQTFTHDEVKSAYNMTLREVEKAIAWNEHNGRSRADDTKTTTTACLLFISIRNRLQGPGSCIQLLHVDWALQVHLGESEDDR